MLEYSHTYIRIYLSSRLLEYLNIWILECGTNQGRGGAEQGLKRNEASKTLWNIIVHYRQFYALPKDGSTRGLGVAVPHAIRASSYAITQRFYNLVNNMGHNGKFVRQMMSSSNRIRLFVWSFACQPSPNAQSSLARGNRINLKKL